MKRLHSLFSSTKWLRIAALVIVCSTLSVASVAQKNTNRKKATTSASRTASKSKSGKKSSNGGALSPKEIYKNMDKYPTLYEYHYEEDGLEGGIIISGKGVKVTSSGRDYKIEAVDPHAFYIHSSWYVESDLSVEFINKADCDRFYNYVKNKNMWPEASKGYYNGWYYVAND